MKRSLTCIVCPRGCALEVSLSDSGEVLSVTGNICKRGTDYAVAECTHPMRTVTSTVRCLDGVVAVKTKDNIPKEKLFDAMREINAVRVDHPLTIGEVVLENVADTGVAVIATANYIKD